MKQTSDSDSKLDRIIAALGRIEEALIESREHYTVTYHGSKKNEPVALLAAERVETEHKRSKTRDDSSAPVERLTMTSAEVCFAIGVKETTRWSLEKRGLLMPIPGIRHKLYSLDTVRRFLEGKNR